MGEEGITVTQGERIEGSQVHINTKCIKHMQMVEKLSDFSSRVGPALSTFENSIRSSLSQAPALNKNFQRGGLFIVFKVNLK